MHKHAGGNIKCRMQARHSPCRIGRVATHHLNVRLCGHCTQVQLFDLNCPTIEQCVCVSACARARASKNNDQVTGAHRSRSSEKPRTWLNVFRVLVERYSPLIRSGIQCTPRTDAHNWNGVREENIHTPDNKPKAKIMGARPCSTGDE